ncbi:MAG: AAA ATPase Elf1 [Vezdaea acicularis]|nr:MAG: AAA ATPase Elf1 [Vezdaea acicularis]
MGKRKKSSRKPQGPRKKETLPSTFECLFCNHEKSVVVKLDKKAGTGELSCKVCGQQYQTGINYLSAAVDVYAAWIDAADAVNKGDHEDDEPHLVHGAHPARGSKANGDEQDGYAEPDAENFIDDKEDPGRLDFEDDE